MLVDVFQSCCSVGCWAKANLTLFMTQKETFFFFSSTTLYEFWLAQLFLSISSSPASFVSNYSLPSSSCHSSHRPPILLLTFPSFLLHTVSICIWSWPLIRWSFFLHAPTSPVIFILYILLYFRYKLLLPILHLF